MKVKQYLTSLQINCTWKQ